MTVRYAGELATNTSLGCFTKLLFRWRGSVYKLIWAEYLIFISIYYVISILYRFALNDEHQRLFEKIVNYCEKSGGSVEMSFVLGFFVTSIVSKWWELYLTVPWPDPVALFINANIPAQDESTKLLKKKVVRYCNLNLALTFRLLSPPFKRRYPTLGHFVKAGLLTDDEKLTLEKMDAKSTHPSQWLPITWASELVTKAAREGKIVNDFACQRILDEMDKFRHGCAMLLEYENFSVPLVYIQVVTISVYTYFLSCLLGSQWLIVDKNLHDLDLYFPFFTTLQFLFYMGWLKVAESLINPFGQDDDDFELEDILDRHFQITTMMVSGKDEKCHNGRTQIPAISLYVNEGFNNDCRCQHNSWKSSSSLNHSGHVTHHKLHGGRSSSSPPPRFSDVMLDHVSAVEGSNKNNEVVLPVGRHETNGDEKTDSLNCSKL